MTVFKGAGIMTEFFTKLAGFIKVLNKPLFTFIVGIGLLGCSVTSLFPPYNEIMKLSGSIFVLLGIAGGAEQFWSLIQKKFCNFKRQKDILKIMMNLNQKERQILKKQFNNKERTFYVNYAEYNNFERGISRYDEYQKIFGVCSGLMQKGILIAQSVTESTAFTITDQAWDLMKKNQTKFFKNLNSE